MVRITSEETVAAHFKLLTWYSYRRPAENDNYNRKRV
jgi:hypothetical protein